MALRANVAKWVVAAVSCATLVFALAPGLALADDAPGDAAGSSAVAVSAEAPEAAVSVDTVAVESATPSATLVPSGSNGLPPITTAATVDTVINSVSRMINTVSNAASKDAESEDEEEEDDYYEKGAVVSGVAEEISDAIDDPEAYLDTDEDEDDEDEDDDEDGKGSSAVATQADGDNAGTGTSASTGSSAGASATASEAHTVTWADQPNGTAELVSVEVNGATLTKAQLEANTSSDVAYFLNGALRAPAGSEVTAKFLPARGYQLVSENICGGAIDITPNDADTAIGEYTFIMPASDVTLDCGFVAVQDNVESDSTAVTGGSISDAESAVANGTLELFIDDMEEGSDKTAIAAKATRASDVVAYLDLTLVNLVYQGAEDISWETGVTSLSSPIALTLELSDEIATSSSQFYIIREFEGQFDQATVTYDASTKSITFKTDKFSSYAIVKGTPSGTNTNTNTNTGTNTSGTSTSGTTNSNTSTTPKTGDTNAPAPLAASALCSAAVAVVALRRLRAIGGDA